WRVPPVPGVAEALRHGTAWRLTVTVDMLEAMLHPNGLASTFGTSVVSSGPREFHSSIGSGTIFFFVGSKRCRCWVEPHNGLRHEYASYDRCWIFGARR